MNIKWTDKYSPKSIDDIIGYNNEIKCMKKWIENYDEYKKINKSLFFICGKCGFGKSVIADLLLKEYNYNTIFITDDDISEVDISDKLEKAMQYRNIFDMFQGADYNKTAIIIDDIDKIASRSTTKSVSNFFKLLDTKKSNTKITVPIICTFTKANKTITRIKKYNNSIRLSKRKEIDIVRIMKGIIKKEGIHCSAKIYKKLYNLCKGDIRMLMNMIKNIIDKNTSDMDDKNKSKNKYKNKYKNKSKKIKNIDNVINNYKKRNFDDELFENMNKIYSIDISDRDNRETIIHYIQNDQFLIPYLIYENTPQVIFNKYKNKVIKCNKQVLEKMSKCYNVFNECNLYWKKIYSEHEHQYSQVLNNLSGVGINNILNTSSDCKNNSCDDIKIANIEYNYSNLLNKTSLIQKRNKKLRLSSSNILLNNKLNIDSKKIKNISEIIYRYLEFNDYKSISEIIKKYNIPYKEICGKNKTKYILSDVLSSMFTLLVNKNKKITKKIETKIVKYLEEYPNNENN